MSEMERLSSRVKDWHEEQDPDFFALVDALIAQARAEAFERAARIAESPGCMTSGQSPLDEWCKKCAAAIRREVGK